MHNFALPVKIVYPKKPNLWISKFLPALLLLISLHGCSAILLNTSELKTVSLTCFFSPMKLVMFIGNNCVEAVNLEESSIILPGYISHFVKMLRCKYEDLIDQSPYDPEFLIHKDE